MVIFNNIHNIRERVVLIPYITMLYTEVSTVEINLIIELIAADCSHYAISKAPDISSNYKSSFSAVLIILILEKLTALRALRFSRPQVT